VRRSRRATWDACWPQCGRCAIECCVEATLGEGPEVPCLTGLCAAQTDRSGHRRSEVDPGDGSVKTRGRTFHAARSTCRPASDARPFPGNPVAYGDPRGPSPGQAPVGASDGCETAEVNICIANPPQLHHIRATAVPAGGPANDNSESRRPFLGFVFAR